MPTPHVPQRGTPDWWEARYQSGQSPWDTGIVPPEVRALVASPTTRRGWALDLGCGSGANSRFMAQHGFRVIGVDLALSALQRAARAAQDQALAAYFCRADVADLCFLSLDVSLALDVGCLHALSPERRVSYARSLAQRLVPGGLYLLYAHEPEPGAAEADAGGSPGLSGLDLAVFVPLFLLRWAQHGWEGERSSNWYLFERA